MDAATLSYVGAAYGASVAVGFSRRAWRTRSAPDALLSLTFLTGIAAVLAIVAGNRAAGDLANALERVESVAMLLSGPALYLYLRSITSGTVGTLHVLHAVPAVVALLAPSFPIAWMVAYQVAYTAAGFARFLRYRHSVDQMHRVWPRILLPLMATVHAAQGIRMSGVPLLDMVPLVLVSTLLAGGGWALTRFTVLQSRKRTVRDSDRELALRLDAVIADPLLYRRPDLCLDDVATAAAMTPHEVSRLLNDVARVSFHEVIARHRVEEARRRLLDPANDIYTIDAIAEAAGFRSRSTFYAAFRRITGITPTEFRRTSRRAH